MFDTKPANNENRHVFWNVEEGAIFENEFQNMASSILGSKNLLNKLSSYGVKRLARDSADSATFYFFSSFPEENFNLERFSGRRSLVRFMNKPYFN